MVSIYDLKPRFQALLRPLCSTLVRLGVTANHVTVAAMVLSLAVGTLICLWPDQRQLLLALPATLFVRMALNAIDGMIAREHDQKTDLGAVLNELGDVISDAALYLPLALVVGFESLLVVPIVILAVVTEMTGVLMAQLGASRRYDGPMGKSDRAFVFGAVGLLLGLGLDPALWLIYVQWAMLGLLAITILNRARRGLAELSAQMQWFTLSIEVRWAMGGIVGLLVAATLITWMLGVLRPDGNFTELRQRMKTWWVMAGVFLIALLLDRTISIIFIAFLSFIALKEYFSLIPARRADRRVMFWAYIAIPVQYLWVAQAWYGMFIVFIPVFMFLLLPMRMVLIGQTDGFLRSAGMLHWGLMATVYSISHAAFLLMLRLKDDPEVLWGPGLMLTLVAMTQLNDVAQYVWGRALGKRRVVPDVSPGKTWAGFVGGVTTTIALTVLIAPWLTPMNHWHALGAGVIIGMGGFIGDITISAIKRDLQVKDSGGLLPGHGGILDRVDSLTFTAPLYFHYVYWLFLWQTHGA